MENIITINSDLRTLEIPAGITNLGVEYDDDVRRLHFSMPKVYDGTDLSGFAVRINYMNANKDGDVYPVTDKAVEGDNITFSWLVGRRALAYKGSVRFIVCLKEQDASGEVLREFNTTPASLPVLEGLETANAVAQEYPDVLEVILQRLDSQLDAIDKLCPSFSETGSVVRCDPLAGYPLTVTTELPATEAGISRLTLTQCGKNLFDYTQYTFENKLITHAHGVSQDSSGFSSTPDHIPVSHLRGLTITLNHPACEKTHTTSAGLAFYDADKKYISGSSGYSHTVPENAEYIRFSVPREWIDGTNGTKEDIQIELGDTVTELTPYWHREFTAEFPEPMQGGTHMWGAAKGEAGGNTFWSSAGTTTVSGKADLMAIINKLTNAVLSLGGTI